MRPEELLKPRYKVISDWPGRRDFVVGEVVTLDKDFSPEYKKYEIEDCGGVRTYITSFFEMFPLQFKRLKWWHERKEDEMPRYIKTDRYVLKVDFHFAYWERTRQTWIAANDKSSCVCDSETFYYENYTPATETEYLAALNQNT